MCSGRIDPIIVFEAFMAGVDGVLVGGCHLGDCNYVIGNYEAEHKIKMAKKLVKQTGIEPDRLRLEWVSASEGQRFADVVKEFVTQIKTLGPNPLSAERKLDMDILERMLAAKLAIADFRLRTLVGKERTLVEEGNVYGEKVPQGDLDEVIDDAVDVEYVRKRIYLLTKEKPLSVKEISECLGIDSKDVLRHIVVMRRKGLIAPDRIEGTSPLYVAQVQEGGR